MNARTTALALAAGALAVTAPVVLAAPAGASGKPTNCTVTSRTAPGIIGKRTIAVDPAGSVVLKRDATNDGLVVVSATPNAGWTPQIEVRTGPKVSAKFQQRHQSIELEAAQSAAYYGPDILVLEFKTCQR